MITGRTACEDTLRRSDLSDCPNWRVRRISFPIRVAYRGEEMQVLRALLVVGCGPRGRASLCAGAGLAGRIVLRRLLPLDCVGKPAPGAVVNTVNGPHRGRVHQLTPHLTQSKPRISHGLRRIAELSEGTSYRDLGAARASGRIRRSAYRIVMHCVLHFNRFLVISGE